MAVDSLGQLTVDLVANTGGFEKGMDRAQRALKSTTKEAAYQAGQLDKLVGQIDPVVAAYGRLDKMEEQLRAHRAAGRLDQVDFTDYLKKLDDQRNSIGTIDTATGKAALSAKAYAAALRNVPAQFTDIAVSLQSGQSPLTVFLQQGGQLKDMFGGAGAAAKALGGYVLGLINPLTVGAAAVAVLALAYKQGSDEAEAYQTALILTGSVSGASVGKLESLAKQISKTTGTVGAAADVLEQLAASGKIPVQSFDAIAVAALKMQEATGKAASETIADFEKLADDPVKASKALNDQLHYLTAALFEQIDALQKNGNVQGAAALAEAAYAEALTSRANKITENLGSVESAWASVKKAAKGGWDAILDIGRESTFEEKMSSLQTQLDNANRLGSGARGGGNRGPAVIKSDITSLYVEDNEKNNRAAAKAIYQDIQDKGIEALTSFNKNLDDSASKSEKMTKELKAARIEIENINRAAKVNGTAPVSDEDAKKRLDGIRDKYKEDKPKAYSEDAGTKMLDSLSKQNAALEAQSTSTVKLNQSQQDLVKWEQELADIKNKKVLTADQKSLLANADQITGQLKVNAALETENDLRKKATEEAQKLVAFQENLKSQLSTAQIGLNNNLAGAGLGAEQKQRLQEQLNIQQSYQSQLDKIESQHNKGEISDTLYSQETASLQTALNQRLGMQSKYYQDLDKAQGDWSNGASSAYQDYLQSAKDVAGQTKSLFSNAFSAMEDAVVNFAMTGKLSFADFAKSVLSDIARIAVHQAETQALSGLAGLFGSAGVQNAGSAAAAAGYSTTSYAGAFGFDTGGYTGDGGKYEPKGIVHGGEFVLRKEVVQQPGMRDHLENLNKTGKGYADGGYVGLSGGGAVPKTSTTSSGPVVIQQNITVPDSSNAAGSGQDMKALGQAYADSAKKGAQDEIAKELRPGGTIWRLVNGR